MGTRFHGVLVPSDGPEVSKVFDSFRPQVPLRLTRLTRGVVGVYCFGGPFLACIREEYRRIAYPMSQVAKSAILYWYDGAAGTAYQVFEKGRVTRERGQEWDESEVEWEAGVEGDLIEKAFCGGCESIAVNIPLVSEIILGLAHEDFAPSKAQRRTSLMNQAQTAERMMEAGNYGAAVEQLESVLKQVQHCVTGAALRVVGGIIEVTIAQFKASSDTTMSH